MTSRAPEDAREKYLRNGLHDRPRWRRCACWRRHGPARLTNGQHGTAGWSDYSLSDASHQQVGQGALTMRSQDDQADAVRPRVLDDRFGNRERGHDGRFQVQHGPVIGGDERVQVRARPSLEPTLEARQEGRRAGAPEAGQDVIRDVQQMECRAEAVRESPSIGQSRIGYRIEVGRDENVLESDATLPVQRAVCVPGYGSTSVARGTLRGGGLRRHRRRCAGVRRVNERTYSHAHAAVSVTLAIVRATASTYSCRSSGIKAAALLVKMRVGRLSRIHSEAPTRAVDVGGARLDRAPSRCINRTITLWNVHTCSRSRLRARLLPLRVLHPQPSRQSQHPHHPNRGTISRSRDMDRPNRPSE